MAAEGFCVCAFDRCKAGLAGSTAADRLRFGEPRNVSTIDVTASESFDFVGCAIFKLLGRAASGRLRKRRRIGSGKALPKAIHSRSAREDRKLKFERDPTDIALRIIFWSVSLLRRSVKNVLHCDKMVASSSLGRCEMTAKDTPYLRPSFAILAIADRVEPNPTLAFAGI